MEEDPQPHRPLRDLIGRGFQLFNRSAEPETVSPTRKTLELFQREDINGRLLILGEPGSGKTTELLGLADDLLRAASEDEVLPIPVIFELSAWDGKPLADWLVEQLYEVETVPKAVGKRWVANAQLLLLLDGLDELGLERQRDCIEAIDKFLQFSPAIQTVVCCRREEYEAAKRQLQQLNGAIYLQEVTNEKIQAYLIQLNRESLWTTLSVDPTLIILARLPLFLTMFIVAYQGQHINNSQDLFNAYIDKQLHTLDNQGAYSPKKLISKETTKSYIQWLSRQLESRGNTDFLIEEIQPYWLNSRKELLWFRYISEIFNSLILVVPTGMIATILLQSYAIAKIAGIIFLATTLIACLDFEIRINLPYGMFVSFGRKLYNYRIKSYELITFSWMYALTSSAIIEPVMAMLACVLFLIFNVRINPEIKQILIVSIFTGLAFSFLSIIIFGIAGSEFSVCRKESPNQGILTSVKNGLSIGLLFFAIASFMFCSIGYLLLGPVSFWIGILIGSFIGSKGALVTGLESACQHLSLRLILYLSGSSPWNYARFLDHAHNLRFIQRVGGRYRFMHDLLRKHFAAMDTQPPR